MIFLVISRLNFTGHLDILMLETLQDFLQAALGACAGYCLIFYFGVYRSRLRMAQKWSILDQTWQACQRSKMVSLSVFDHLGPFWSISNKN